MSDLSWHCPPLQLRRFFRVGLFLKQKNPPKNFQKGYFSDKLMYLQLLSHVMIQQPKGRRALYKTPFWYPQKMNMWLPAMIGQRIPSDYILYHWSKWSTERLLTKLKRGGEECIGEKETSAPQDSNFIQNYERFVLVSLQHTLINIFTSILFYRWKNSNMKMFYRTFTVL